MDAKKIREAHVRNCQSLQMSMNSDVRTLAAALIDANLWLEANYSDLCRDKDRLKQIEDRLDRLESVVGRTGLMVANLGQAVESLASDVRSLRSRGPESQGNVRDRQSARPEPPEQE